MSADQLYSVLRPAKDTAIPLLKAAEYFVQVKLASGGWLPDELDLMKAAMNGQVTPEEIQDALSKGSLSGIRSSAAQDIVHGVKLQRTKGERVGKEVGLAGGALAGLMAGKGSPQERLLRAGVGGVIGRGAGKLVGQKVDENRLTKFQKAGELNKVAASISPAAVARLREMLGTLDVEQLRDTALTSGASGGADSAISDTLTAAGTMAGSHAPGKYKIPAMLAGGLAGKGAAGLASRGRSKIARVDENTAVMGNEPMAEDYPADLDQKAPLRDATGNAPEAEPMLIPDADLQPSPLDAILDLLQKGNEAEHFQQKAEDAEATVDQAKEQAQMAQEQLQKAQKDQAVAEQMHAEEVHAARTEAEAAKGENAVIQQQMMSGQQQLQSAQAQTVQLMQAINGFRQSLIDMLAQDPTQAAAPGGMVPSAPGQIMQDPSQQMPPGAPGAAGPPGAEAQGGMPPAPGQPPAEQAPPAAQGEAGPPKKESKPEGGEKKPEPKGDAKPASEGGDKAKGSKTEIHVH